MGFQTFTCVICGESCTRRTSKRYGEGRACNKHQEVQDDQQKHITDQLNRELSKILSMYKAGVGKKHPVKDKLREWLANTVVGQWRKDLQELPYADKVLTLFKQTGLISIQYEVMDDFVNKMMELIKVHENDDDWETLRKEAKAHAPKSEKAKHIEREVKAKRDEDHNFKVKERRGAKEAPRRRAGADKRR